MKPGSISVGTGRSTGGYASADRGISRTVSGNHLVGNLLRGFRTTVILEDVGRLGDLSGNPKSLPESFIDEMISMMERETVKVLWTIIQDEIEDVPKNGSARTHEIIDTEVRLRYRGYVPQSSDKNNPKNQLQRRESETVAKCRQRIFLIMLSKSASSSFPSKLLAAPDG